MNSQQSYISIRIWIPVIILISVTFLLTAMAYIIAENNEQRYIRDTRQWLSHEMSSAVLILATDLQDHDLIGVEHTVSRLALLPEIRFAGLLDANQNIVASTQYAAIGEPASIIDPLYSDDERRRVQRLNNHELIQEGEALLGYSALEVTDSDAGLRDTEHYMLYLRYDLRPGIEKIEREALFIYSQFWLLALVLSLILVWFLSKKLSRPLKALATASREIAEGKYGGVISLDSRGEIGVLVQSFNHMSEKIETTLDALQALEMQQRLILSSTAEGIFGVDLDGCCIFANHACLSMLGYEAESQILGKNLHTLIQHHHSDGSEYAAISSRIALSYVSGEDVHVTDEVFWHRNGSSFPVEYRAKPLRKQREIIGAVISFTDISEHLRLKSAEREAYSMMKTILDHAPALISTKDENGNINFANLRHEVLEGITPDSLVGKNIYELYPEQQADEIWRSDLEAQKQYDGVEVEERLQHKDGTWHTYLTLKFALRNEEGDLLGSCGIATDITDRIQKEQQIRLLSQAVEQTPLSVFITDKRGIIQYVNPEFERSTGYSKEEALGQTPRIMKSGLNADYLYRKLWSTILVGNTWHGELQNMRKDGELYWENMIISPLSDDDGDIQSFICIKEDITSRKQSEAQIMHQAQYDALTDLPNRSLAADRLDQAMLAAARSGHKVAVLFVDLDDFKRVNDTLGHDVGDALLVEAAARLQMCVRKQDTLSRQGGDEFLVVLNDLTKSSEAERVAGLIGEHFSRPFELSGMSFMVTASIGIAIYPDDAEDRSTLIRHADAAMYKAKDEGRNTFHFFAPDINEEAQRKLSIEQHLQSALANGEFEVYYQSLVDTASQNIIGAEALLRWHSTSLGAVSPAEFIPVAEQTGLIVQIGDWVLQTAASQAVEWCKLAPEGFYISVNVSPRQFRGRGILDSVSKALCQGLSPESLEVEVTEGLLLRNHPDTEQTLVALNEQGIRIAMDDFGTGYSSLNYVRKYPFSTLKIDQSFVRDLEVDEEDRELVQATVAMALGLGLKVVGEGVETREQYQFLRALNCHVVQGYLFSKPMPAVQFTKLLESNRRLQDEGGESMNAN